MTLLWRICFSALWLWPLLAASVSGRVELVQSRDPAVQKHKDYSGVVVWLEPLGSPAPKAPVPWLPKRVEMVQKNKRFVPHVLAIRVGATVDFPNFDPIFHNAFSNFSGQPFDVGLYPPGSSRSVLFHRDGIVRVFCNIHPTMSAVIVVLNTPWFGVSHSDGEFDIGNVPPGDYQMHFFHERASAKELKSLERKITVDADSLKLAVIDISELGYLPGPHKNKYGKEYPPVPDDHVFYPGVLK